MNVIEKPNDNDKGKTVGDDKIVEKDKEVDGLGDEDILTGKSSMETSFHINYPNLQKKKKRIAADQQREKLVLFDCIVWNGYYHCSDHRFQYIYRVASPKV